mgnify:CR=1 FL=1
MTLSQIKIITIGLVSTISIGAAISSYTQSLPYISNRSPTINNPSTILNNLFNDTHTPTFYTTKTVSQHSSPSDCWTIISNKIYNISEYLPFHPGGIDTITFACGKDATQAFQTKGGRGRSHLPSTYELLNKYFIADLNSPMPQTDNSNNTQISSTPTPSTILNTLNSNTSLSSTNISSHNSASDCWLTINNQIYNVTQYIPFHPGGSQRIIDYCGKDATQAFNTKGGSGSHTTNARKLLANYLVGNDGATNTPTPTIKATPTTGSSYSQSSGTYTSSQVTTHNSQSDCWLIINNQIYNVTQYIPFHPGGTQQIINNCGKEATQAFNTKGGSGSHSTNARNLLANYLIGSLNNSSSTSTNNPTSTPINSQPIPTNTPVSQTSSGSYTASEVATHNTQSNCWLIINNQIYNVTQYIPFHPGGTQRIVNYCGKEATQAFNTRGGSGSHSNNAKNMLANYLIGTLNTGSSNPTPTTNPNNPNPTNTPVPQQTNNSPSAAVLAVYPNATITSVQTEDDGRSVVKFTNNGKKYEAKLDASNNIIKIEN